MQAKVRGDPNPEVNKDILARTEAEVKDGKAAGPLTEKAVDSILGKFWAPARRVGLAQSSGVRPILRAQRRVRDAREG